jgi:hypothetical protein
MNTNRPNFDLAALIKSGKATPDQIASAQRMTDPSRTKKVGAHDVLVAALATLDPARKPRKSQAKPAVVKVTEPTPVKAKIVKVGRENVMLVTEGVAAKSVTRASKGMAAELNAEALRRFENSEPMTEDDLNRVGNYVWKLAFDATYKIVGKEYVKTAQGFGDTAKNLFLAGSHDIGAAVKAVVRPAMQFAAVETDEEREVIVSAILEGVSA